MNKGLFNRIDALDCLAGSGVVASIIAVASTAVEQSGLLVALSVAVLLMGALAGAAVKLLGQRTPPESEQYDDQPELNSAELDPAELDPAELDPAELDPAELDPAELDPDSVAA